MYFRYTRVWGTCVVLQKVFKKSLNDGQVDSSKRDLYLYIDCYWDTESMNSKSYEIYKLDTFTGWKKNPTHIENLSENETKEVQILTLM